VINIIDPKKVPELSEQEKWVCTVKWLNSLYSGHYALLNGEFTNLEEYIEYAEEAEPCSNECPYYEKCPSTAREPYRPFVPIPIIECWSGLPAKGALQAQGFWQWAIGVRAMPARNNKMPKISIPRRSYMFSEYNYTFEYNPKITLKIAGEEEVYKLMRKARDQLQDLMITMQELTKQKLTLEATMNQPPNKSAAEDMYDGD